MKDITIESYEIKQEKDIRGRDAADKEMWLESMILEAVETIRKKIISIF